MRELSFPLLSLYPLTTACKGSAPSPTIEMGGFHVNDGEMDYARQVEASPSLKVDDELETSLKLDGNRGKPSTSSVKEETLDSEVSAVTTDLNGLLEEALNDDKELTDKDNDKLGFKDGVSQTKMGLWTKVR